MGIHAVSYHEEWSETDGPMELVDIDYQCSARCMGDVLEAAGVNVDTLAAAGSAPMSDAGAVSWGAYPCGDETDYDVYCAGCGVLLWHGLERD